MGTKTGKYGKHTDEITAIIEAVKKFTKEDFKKLAAAYAAAAYAYAADAYAYAADAYAADAYADAYAAAYAAADAAAYAAADGWYWPTRRVVWRAILAWLAKDKITQEQFDLLLKPWREHLASISDKPTTLPEVADVSEQEKFFRALNNDQVYILNSAPKAKDGGNSYTGFQIVVMEKSDE